MTEAIYQGYVPEKNDYSAEIAALQAALSYAAVQAWAPAIDKAGSLELQAVIASLRTHQFDTVLGPISFDGKGDLTAQSWIWYVWKSGEYVPLE